MSDIVERLRMWKETGAPARDCQEAAVEIERLRAALIKIRDDGKNCADHCRHQARRAIAFLCPDRGAAAMYDCVCDYDSPEVYRSKMVRARKQYGCEECGGKILVGDTYEYHFGVQYGDSYSGHTCVKCIEIRDWVTGNIPCFCWAHGNMIEDARGAVDEACYRAPKETVGIRFGFARRLHMRDEYHRARIAVGGSREP